MGYKGTMGSPDYSPPPWTVSSSVVPPWLTALPAGDPKLPLGPTRKELLVKQFEMVFPIVLERISEGITLTAAVRNLPDTTIPIEVGMFMSWMKKQPGYYEMFRDAKEVGTTVWEGEIIKHSLGAETEDDIARSKLIVDTYKWLMGAHNRKTYGDSKQIEVVGNISIASALAEAQGRVIDAQVVDDDLIDVTDYKQIVAPDSTEDDD